MEFCGHGEGLVTHFGISEGKGGVKTWKPSVVGYGYFLELPIVSFAQVYKPFIIL